MASASEAILKTIKEEGKFQNDPSDTGNFLKGVNYGTKFGVTPAAFLSYYKNQPLQSDTIKNLTVDQVIPIYKTKYWDKMRGDEIENHSLAELMMFVVVNSGTGQVATFKKLINLVAGKKIVSETSSPFTSDEIKLLNSLDQKLYFDALKGARKKFYENLAAKDSRKAKYLKGWLNRLDKYQFVEEKKKSKIIFIILLILVALLLFWWFVARK